MLPVGRSVLGVNVMVISEYNKIFVGNIFMLWKTMYPGEKAVVKVKLPTFYGFELSLSLITAPRAVFIVMLKASVEVTEFGLLTPSTII